MTNAELAKLVVDPLAEVGYSIDQMYIDHPVVFPCATLPLCDTPALNAAADEIREKCGFLPCFNGEKCDSNGWYEFSIGVYGVAPGVENCITFIYNDGWSDIDASNEYTIDLTDEQRKLLFPILDAACRESRGTSIEELLEECAEENDIVWNKKELF